MKDEELIEELKKRFQENKKNFEKVTKLNDELQLVNQKLRDSEQLKSNFLSNISNEIVNPFTSIMGLAESITTCTKDNVGNARKMARMIFNEAFSLDFQLKNIFTAAHIEAGLVRPQYAKVDVNQLVKHKIDKFRHLFEEKEIDVEYSIDFGKDSENFIFQTDPEKLDIVVVNLLSNAIKYCFNNKKIFIDVIKAEVGLEIRIKDEGVGISEENRNKIFDRFKKLDTGIHDLNRGHGLGLSVIKAIIEILDGDLKLKTNDGIGAEFTVRIPESHEVIEDAGFATDSNELFFFDEETF